MKRLEEFTPADLSALRSEIVLGSLFTSDYRNTYGIAAVSVHEFFASYEEWLEEEEEEDSPEKLEEFWGLYDNFSWVEYDEEA